VVCGRGCSSIAGCAYGDVMAAAMVTKGLRPAGIGAGLFVPLQAAPRVGLAGRLRLGFFCLEEG
jgi:hypothetical protein